MIEPRLAAALAAILWGLTYILTSTILPPHPFFVGAVRGLGSGLILLAIARQPLPMAWLPKVLVLGTLNAGLLFGLAFIGMLRMPGGPAATILATSPLSAVILARLFFGQVPTLGSIAGVLIGAIGVAMVMLRADAAVDAIGFLSILTASTSVALGALLTERWGRPVKLSLTAFTGWQLLFAGGELAIVTVLTSDLPERLTMANIAGLAVLTVLITAVGFILWFGAIARIGGTNAAPVLLLVPIVAFVVDAIVLAIIPTPYQSLGILITILGLLMAQWAGRKRPGLPPPLVPRG